MDNIQTTTTPAPVPAFLQKYLALRTSGQDHEQACESYAADLPLEPSPLEAVWDVVEENNQFRARRDAFAHRLAMTARPVPTVTKPAALSQSPNKCCNQNCCGRGGTFIQPPETYVIPPYRGSYSSRSEEWGSNRAGQPTNPAKFYAKKLNDAHSAFLADELDLEQYTDEIFSFLEPNATSEDIFAFLTIHSDKIADGSFCPDNLKFSTKLNKLWKAYSDSNGVTVSPVEEQEQEEAIADDSALSAPIKAVKLRTRVEAAYAGFVAGEVSQFDFLTVTREFVLRRVSHKFEGDKLGKTEQDVTQIAMIKMSDALDNFIGSSGEFFVWTRQIADNTVLDAKKEAMRDLMRHAPLYVTNEDGVEGLNPALHGGIKVRRNGKTVFQDPAPQVRKQLPDFIQGTDLKICEYLRYKGYSYGRIADELGLTVTAVTQRIRKMRQMIQEAK